MGKGKDFVWPDDANKEISRINYWNYWLDSWTDLKKKNILTIGICFDEISLAGYGDMAENVSWITWPCWTTNIWKSKFI